MIITDKTATLTIFRIQSSVSSQLDLEKSFHYFLVHNLKEIYINNHSLDINTYMTIILYNKLIPEPMQLFNQFLKRTILQ